MDEKQEWFDWRHNDGIRWCRPVQVRRYMHVVFYIKNLWQNDFRLYHGDGIGEVKSKSRPETEKIKKNMQENI